MNKNNSFRDSFEKIKKERINCFFDEETNKRICAKSQHKTPKSMLKTSVVILLVFILSVQSLTGQKITSYQSNPDISLDNYLKGVKYAEIMLPNDIQIQVDNNTGVSSFFVNAKSFLEGLGFTSVLLTSDEKLKLNSITKTYCDIVSVNFSGNLFQNTMKNLGITFISCNGDVWHLQSQNTINYKDLSSVSTKLINEWKTLYNRPIKYNEINRLSLSGEFTSWNENAVKYYFEHSQANELEGIYERVQMTIQEKADGKFKIAIIKDPSSNEHLIIYLSGAKNNLDWKDGELKGKLLLTGTPDLYKIEWINASKSEVNEAYGYIDEVNMLNIAITEVNIAHKFIRLLPVEKGISVNGIKASGSGFAISSSGLIVTNFHVIENGKSFQIEGTKNGLKVSYNALVILKDWKNDLAILKIDDNNFKGFENIPYGVETKIADV